MMWDVDLTDWKRPKAEAIAREEVTNAYPGAVAWMHDGGGDRSQALETLPRILSQLGAEGCGYEAHCRN